MLPRNRALWSLARIRIKKRNILAATICRARSDRARARAISRCVQFWTQKEDLEQLLENENWHDSDRAAAWAIWFRHHQQSEKPETLARYAVRSILEGTARVHGADAFQRVELLAEVALASREPDVQNDGLHHIKRLIESSSVPAKTKIRMWLNLARIARPVRGADGKWSNWPKFFILQAENAMADLYGHGKVELLAEFARSAFRRKESHEATIAALREAKDEANRSPDLTRRITGFCEVAEAAADCHEFRLADELFAQAERLIPASHAARPSKPPQRSESFVQDRGDAPPPDANPPPGLKLKKVRPYLLAELLSGLAKAASRHPWAGVYQLRWVQVVQDRRLLDELKVEPHAYHETCRAFAVAGAWQALFDSEYQSDKTTLWRQVHHRIEEITNPATKARTQRDLAVLEARADLADPGRIGHALRRITGLADGFDKDDVLHRVGAILAHNALEATRPEQRDRHLRAYLQVLPSSAEYFGATYLMLAKLVRLFPQSASAIHELLKRRTLIELSPIGT